MVVAALLLSFSAVLSAPPMRPHLMAMGMKRWVLSGGIWLFGLAGFFAIGISASPARVDRQASGASAATVVLILLAGWGTVAAYRAYRRNRVNRACLTPPATDRSAPFDHDPHNDNVRAWITNNARVRTKRPRRRDSLPAVLAKPVVASSTASRPKRTLEPKAGRLTGLSLSDVGTPLQNGPAGSRLKFEYVNANGEITDRSLTNWIEYVSHVRGYCSKREAVRTFRKDRVLEWSDGVSMLVCP